MNKLNKLSGQELSKFQMNKVTGGSRHECECLYGAKPPYSDSWDKEYDKGEEMAGDIISRCINGEGRCN